MYNPHQGNMMGHPQPGMMPPQQPMNMMTANAPVGAMHAGPNSHSSTTNVIVNQQPQGGGRQAALKWQMGKGRPWVAELCGCCDDMQSCCCVMLFPYCYLFYLTKQMDESLCTPCFVPYTLPALRIKLRASENIEGSICWDCFLSYACEPCVMCQLQREMKAINLERFRAMQYGA